MIGCGGELPMGPSGGGFFDQRIVSVKPLPPTSARKGEGYSTPAPAAPAKQPGGAGDADDPIALTVILTPIAPAAGSLIALPSAPGGGEAAGYAQRVQQALALGQLKLSMESLIAAAQTLDASGLDTSAMKDIAAMYARGKMAMEKLAKASPQASPDAAEKGGAQ